MGLIERIGRSMVIAVNQWDGLSEYDREQIKEQMDRKLVFIDYARRYFISALHGTGVGKLYAAINEARKAQQQPVPTNRMMDLLSMAITKHQPPLSKGRRIKLRMAHLGGRAPFKIIIHGKQVEGLPGSYVRFLKGYFRDALKLVGTPITIKLMNDKNPYDKK